MKLNPNKVAMTLGVFAAIVHAVRGVIVALGWAPALMSWMLDLHFLNNPFTVQPFNLTRWVTLIVVTAVIGYAVGYIFATVWNKVNK
jgi:hypothetical protein